MIGSSAERPTAIQNRYLIACLRMSLSWSMVAVGLRVRRMPRPGTVLGQVRVKGQGQGAGLVAGGAPGTTGAGVTGIEPGVAGMAPGVAEPLATSCDCLSETASMSDSLGITTTEVFDCASVIC